MRAGSSGRGAARDGAGSADASSSGPSTGGAWASGASAARRSASATRTRGSASASNHSTSGAVQRRLIGTAAAPTVAAARNVSAHASEFGSRPGDVVIENGTVRVPLRPGTAKPEILRQLTAEIEAVLGREPGVAKVDVRLARAEESARRDPWAARAALPGVARIIAVASTKG